MASEKRLIDYEMARNATYEEVFWTESEQAVVRHFLAKLPTADAVEVVHGRCKKSDDREEWYTYYYTCLECGATMMVADADYHDVSPNYCPNCGAKMDGGNEDGLS